MTAQCPLCKLFFHLRFSAPTAYPEPDETGRPKPLSAECVECWKLTKEFPVFEGECPDEATLEGLRKLAARENG